MGSVSNIAGAIAQQQSATTAGAGGVPSLATDFNTFLTLLTTQLKNQDPTNPVDSNQFTQQLVEFAGVQQQTQTNTLLQQLLTATQGNQISSASSYIGTTIQATGNQLGLASGASQFGYTLAAKAADVKVTISDSSGNVVYTGTGPANAGANLVQWDGTNGFTGAAEPDGTYTVKVTAADINGASITATPFETGAVSSASISNGQVMLSVNGLQIPVGNVTSITNLNASSQANTQSLLQQLLSSGSSSQTPTS